MDIKKLSSPDFEINGIKFKITKLSPMAGHEMLESMRFAIVSSAGVAEGDGEDENAALFFKAVLALHPDLIRGYRDTLFANVEFSGDTVKAGWAVLHGLEDMAFGTLEPVHVYEVFVRCLIVNFTESFSAIASRFPGGKAFFKRLKPKTSHSS